MQAEVADEKEQDLSLPLHKIRLPPGFQIEIYAENLSYVRSLALSPNGTLFAGTRRYPLRIWILPGLAPLCHF